MMWPGSCFGYGRNKTKHTYCADYNVSEPFESRMETAISWVTNETSPANLVFLYFEEPDEHAHGFGPESEEVRETVEKMDNVTGYLVSRLKELGIFEEVNLILLSDHGFAEVRQERILNITDILDPQLYTKYGSSPTYLILPHEGKNQLFSKSVFHDFVHPCAKDTWKIDRFDLYFRLYSKFYF